MSVESLFSKPLKVINVGLQSFAQDLRAVGIECRQVTLAPVERAGNEESGEASPTPTSTESG